MEIGEVLQKLTGVKKSGSQWVSRCPAHDDHSPSLAIRDGDKGIIFKCHTGCETEDIVAAIGLEMKDLFRDDNSPPPLRFHQTQAHPVIKAIYCYRDANDVPLYRVIRYEPKDFRVQHPLVPNPGNDWDKWAWGLNGTPRVPYHLSSVLKGIASNSWVFVVEGEKDVQSLEHRGFVATTNSGGAGKWDADHSRHLAGARVIVLPDGDEPGKRHADLVAASLEQHARETRIVRLPRGKDITEWFDSGGTPEELSKLVEAAKPAGFHLIADADLLELAPSQIRWAVPDLLPEGLALLAGAPKMGKALEAGTPIFTPNGWVRIMDLRVGDYVFGTDGKPCQVTATQTWADRPCFELGFDNGTGIIADENHDWVTRHANGRNGIGTTKDIAGTLIVREKGRARFNHSIRLGHPIYGMNNGGPIGPYTLGAWLGDGSRTSGAMTCAESDIQIMECIGGEGYSWHRVPSQPFGYRVVGLQKQLKTLGILYEKFIPKQYLTAGIEHRLSLLQGLMDTDGSCDKLGTCEYSSVSMVLALHVAQLLRTLGVKTRIREGAAKLNGIEVSRRYRMTFRTNLPVFRLKRKSARQKTAHHRVRSVRIIGANYSGRMTTVCIEVDSRDHMYLAGHGMIPTHNSYLSLALAGAVGGFGLALGSIPVHKGKSVYLALEDTDQRVKRRREVMFGGSLPGFYCKTQMPRWGDPEWLNLEKWLVQNPDCRLVIVDTLVDIKPDVNPKKTSMNVYETDAGFASEVKAMADRTHCCILLVHHLNKGDTISGSQGIPAKCDTILEFRRDREDEACGHLKVKGREVEQRTLKLWFNPATFHWTTDPVYGVQEPGDERRMIVDMVYRHSRPISIDLIRMDLKDAGKPQTPEALRKMMSRLVAQGVIERVSAGIYSKPNAGDIESDIGSDTTRDNERDGGVTFKSDIAL